MDEAKSITVVETVGVPLCEHEPKKLGEHWTCLKCGERVPGCDHEPKQLGPHWTCVRCGERVPPPARPEPAAAPAPAPAPAGAPSPEKEEPELEEPDLLDGLGWDASDERIAASKRRAAKLLDEHKAKNEERLANSQGGVQEHVDNIEAAVKLGWDFLTGG